MSTFIALFGGVGLFLLGMSLLTDGLKNFAGDALRRALLRFTGTPLKAFLSGTIATLLVQSLSATTVTVIGFVSAGLLTFPQALGVVFGASLGTTGTSWIVAWIGLKVNVGLYALPLVGIGAFFRLLGKGRWKSLGEAIAGFALIFVGIDTLQSGMKGIAGALNLAAGAKPGPVGDLIAIVVGLSMTVAMQSSSAAVAATLTALSAQAVHFEQAAAMVIGAAIGTTVTSAVASIGASVPAKRTALAHVLFSLATGLIALALLPGFLWWIERAKVRFGWEQDATSLAAFHTAFIGLGVILFMPFVRWFAAGIESLLPDAGPQLTRHLDRTVRETPAVALEATRRALQETAAEMIRVLLAGLKRRQWDAPTADIQLAIDRIQSYLESLHANPDDPALVFSRVEQMHAIDHVARLFARINPPPPIRATIADPNLAQPVADCSAALEMALEILEHEATADQLAALRELARRLQKSRHDQRVAIFEQTGYGLRRPAAAIHLMDGFRWLERVGHHVWRACSHLCRPMPKPPRAELSRVEEFG